MSEFDDIFKDKLYQREVPFNPSAWQQAEAMLNAQQGASTAWGLKRWAAVLLFAVVGMGTGIWGYDYLTNTSEKAYSFAVYDNDSNGIFILDPIIFPKRYAPSKSEDATLDAKVDPRAGGAERISRNEGENSATNHENIASNQIQRTALDGMPQASADGTSQNVETGKDAERIAPSARDDGTSKFQRSQSTRSLFLAPSSLGIPFALKLKANEKQSMRAQSVPHTDFSNDPAKPSKAPFKHHSLSANFGFGGYASFAHIKEKRYSPGMNMQFGLNYAYALSESFAIGIGARYGFRGGSPMEYIVEEVIYDFGVEKKVSTYQTNQLHRLHIPLTAAYTIAGKHVLEGGLQPSLLLTTKSTVSSFNEGAQGTSEVEKSQEWGYVNGHTPLQLGMILGYQYALSNNWNIGVRGTLGVTDMTDDQHFGFSHSDLDRQIHLTLRYRFLEF